MRIVLRNNITDAIKVEIFDQVEEGLSDNEVNEMIMNAQGLDEEIEALLQNEKYYISYEESNEE